MTPFDPALFVEMVRSRGGYVEVVPGWGSAEFGLHRSIDTEYQHDEEYCAACRASVEHGNAVALVTYLLSEPGARERVEEWRAMNEQANRDRLERIRARDEAMAE